MSDPTQMSVPLVYTALVGAAAVTLLALPPALFLGTAVGTMLVASVVMLIRLKRLQRHLNEVLLFLQDQEAHRPALCERSDARGLEEGEEGMAPPDANIPASASHGLPAQPRWGHAARPESPSLPRSTPLWRRVSDSGVGIGGVLIGAALLFPLAPRAALPWLLISGVVGWIICAVGVVARTTLFVNEHLDAAAHQEEEDSLLEEPTAPPSVALSRYDIHWPTLERLYSQGTVNRLRTVARLFAPLEAELSATTSSTLDPLHAIRRLSWGRRPLVAPNDSTAVRAHRDRAAIEERVDHLLNDPVAAPMARALLEAFVTDRRIALIVPLDVPSVLDGIRAWRGRADTVEIVKAAAPTQESGAMGLIARSEPCDGLLGHPDGVVPEPIRRLSV